MKIFNNKVRKPTREFKINSTEAAISTSVPMNSLKLETS